MAVYTGISTVASGDVLPTTYLNAIVDNMTLFSAHNHSPSSGEGGSILKVGSATACATERVYFSPVDRNEFSSTSGFTIAAWGAASTMPGANVWGFGLFGTTNANADWLKVAVYLFKGTYKAQVLYTPQASGGAACVSMGGSAFGIVIETYAASSTASFASASWSMTVPTTGSYALQILQASSNASSGGCRIELGPLTIVKTSH